jgi:hypothetical protein
MHIHGYLLSSDLFVIGFGFARCITLCLYPMFGFFGANIYLLLVYVCVYALAFVCVLLPSKD